MKNGYTWAQFLEEHGRYMRGEIDYKEYCKRTDPMYERRVSDPNHNKHIGTSLESFMKAEEIIDSEIAKIDQQIAEIDKKIARNYLITAAIDAGYGAMLFVLWHGSWLFGVLSLLMFLVAGLNLAEWKRRR